jgi:molybdenum cofactor guanylyltransferase
MMPATVNDITVVILAGGKGRRMGGADKGLVTFKNIELIKHVIDGISRQSGQIVINANRNLEQYQSFGYPVVEDTLSGFQGPLSGFLAAMAFVDTRYILTLPCDGPVVTDDYVTRMLQVLNETESDLVVASDGDRMQPVYALIPVSLQQDLKQFLQAGERKIDLWYARHRMEQAEFAAELGLFTNINTLEELSSKDQAIEN